MNIYLSSETNFENNGLGFLNDCTKANVYETLNGDYYLELSYPINGNLNQYLIEENIIKCNVGNNNYQLFKITRITKDFSLIKVYAKHITYNLLDNMILDAYPKNKNCQAFGEWILEKTDFNHPFSFYSDITNTATARYIQKNPIEAIMGSEDNSMVNLFDGELERDNFTIKMLKNRGINNGVKLIFGKNIKSINIVVDISTLFTRILPIGGNGLMLPENYVDSPLINSYPTPKIARVEFSDIKYDPNDENSYPSEEEAIIALRAAANELFEKGIDKPSINIKIDWVELSKTKEYYEEYHSLEKVNIGDTITASILGIDYTTKVIKTNYNVLTDTIDNFEIGSASASITSTINTQSTKINEINPNNILEEAIKNSTNLITSAMGGFVYKTNEELYIMDTNDINTAQKVWRWNINGLGYSKTGVNGPYGIAMTMDGSINADFITSGMIQTNRVQGLDSLIIDIQAKQGEITKEITTRKTATGNPAYIEDSGGYALEKDFIYGMSIQEISTQGKNLFDKSRVQFGYYSIPSGNLTTGNTNWYYINIKVKPSTTYYFSGVSTANTSIGIVEFNSNDEITQALRAYGNGPFTTTENCSYIGVSCRVVDVDNIQLELGDTKTDLEQFIPNMPSPDYPSEIINNRGIENLFDYEKPTSYGNGLSFTKKADGSFIASGIVTSTWANLSANGCLPKSLEIGTYTISHTNLTHNISVIFGFEDGTESSRYSLKGKKSVVATFGKVVTKARFFVESLTSGNSYTIEDNIQIEKGTIAHAPVPYGSNYLVQTICGKNIFKPTLQTTTVNGITCTKNKDGTYTLNGTATAGTSIDIFPEKTIPSGTYKVVGCPIGGSASTYYLASRFDGQWGNKDTGNGAIITFTNFGKLSLSIASGVKFTNVVMKPMITPDTSLTYNEYEPYKEKQVLFDLQGNFLGNEDETELVSGALAKNVKELVLTGNEAFTENGIYSGLFALPNMGLKSSEYEIVVISTHFKGIEQHTMFIDLETGYNNDLVTSAYTNDRLFIVYKKYAKNLSGFKAFLKEQYDNGTPVIVQYVLAEPQTMQLEPTEIITYEGINNIYTESNVDVEEVDITYLTKSTLNQDFLSKAEFSIKENEINQQVSQKVGENEIVASINTAIKDGQGVLEFTGNSVIISADNMSVDKYGNLVCQNAIIRGSELILNDDGTHENASIKIKTNKKIIKDIAITSDLNDSYLTQTFGDKFNFREAASQVIFTTDKNYQVKLLRTTVGSSSHVVGYTHQVVVSNNNDYNEIIYEVFHNQDEGIFTTNIDIQELKLPSEFGVVKTINSSTYLPYIKKLLINAGLTTYSSEGMEADIYSNYKYTRDDYIKVQKYLLGQVTLTAEEILFYDTNGDGKVTLPDMIVIGNNGGQYNVSDSQPGKFILDTTGISENLYVLDKDGNKVVSMGVTGTKVLTLNHPVFPDSHNQIEVGDALTYKKGELESVCGTWDDGKLIYRRVIHVENISATAIPNWSALIDLDIDIDTMVKIEGSYQVTGNAWTPINMPLSSSQAISTHYNDDTKQLHIMSTFDISRGHIILEYTKN